MHSSINYAPERWIVYIPPYNYYAGEGKFSDQSVDAVIFANKSMAQTVANYYKAEYKQL